MAGVGVGGYETIVARYTKGRWYEFGTGGCGGWELGEGEGEDELRDLMTRMMVLKTAD
jgi:hypothetical protein